MVGTLITYDDLKVHRLVPVVVSDNVENGLRLLQALGLAGISCVEIALRTAASLELLAEAAQLDGMVVGAGTVLNPKLLDESLAAGAKFIVTPGLSDQVLENSVKAHIPVVPGVATPTDIMRVLDHGLDHVKVFPVESLGGLDYLKALAGPFPNLKFMPSGGVNGQNFISYLKTPNVFSVSGSWMLPTKGQTSIDLVALKDLAMQVEGLS